MIGVYFKNYICNERIEDHFLKSFMNDCVLYLLFLPFFLYKTSCKTSSTKNILMKECTEESYANIEVSVMNSRLICVEMYSYAPVIAYL